MQVQIKNKFLEMNIYPLGNMVKTSSQYIPIKIHEHEKASNSLRKWKILKQKGKFNAALEISITKIYRSSQVFRKVSQNFKVNTNSILSAFFFLQKYRVNRFYAYICDISSRTANFQNNFR